MNDSYVKRQIEQVKKIKVVVVSVVIAVFSLAMILGSAYTLDVEHAAIVTTLGKPEAVTESGLHFKIPIIQTVEKVDTTIKGLAIGYDLETNQSIDAESTMITSDYNFINVDFYIEYQISDPVKAWYNSQQPLDILKSVAQNCIRTVIASYNVDTVLTTGKSEIQSNIKSMLVEKIDDLDLGITVRSVTVQDSEPPTAAVSEAFKAVETAKQNKATEVNNANKYRNEQIPAAEANVDKILQEAEATKAKRIAEAEGQVARFNAMYEEYKKYPAVTKERMFFEAMEDILPKMKVIISGGENGVDTVLPLDSFANITNNTSNGN